jgi:acetoin utilization protein AcuB
MTRHPVMVSPETLITEARRVFVENGIGHLPVVSDGKKLLGLITHTHFSMNMDTLDSLDFWEISRKMSDVKVKNVMIKAKKIITVDPNTTVEFAANLLSENNIGCLPVVDEENQVVGMITTIDLLRSYQEMLGLPTPGVRVTVRMPAKKHGYSEFAKLISSIADQDWGVMGIGTFPTPNHPESYDAVVKIPGVNIDAVRQVIEAIPEHHIVDIREVG